MIRIRIVGWRARKLIHRYGESVLSTRETSFAVAAWLLSLMSSVNVTAARAAAAHQDAQSR